MVLGIGIRIFALGAIALFSGNCGEDPDLVTDDEFSCDIEARADTYVVDLEKVSTNGLKTRLRDSLPAPPAKGDNIWTIQVLDSADAPVDGLDIAVDLLMPDHGHGTPINAEVTALGSEGEYEISPVNLWMPGYWEVTLDLGAEDDPDTVTYSFCIEG